MISLRKLIVIYQVSKRDTLYKYESTGNAGIKIGMYIEDNFYQPIRSSNDIISNNN